MTLPIAPFIVLSASQIVALLLVILLLGASYVAWAMVLLQGQQTGTFGRPRSEEPRADWRLFPDLMAVGLTLLLISVHLLPKLLHLFPSLTPESESVTLTTRLLLNTTAFTCGLTAVLAAFLASSGRSPTAYGFKWNSISRQVADGVFGFLLSLLPMAAMMLATAMYRTKETRNSLFNLLADSSDPWTVLLIGVTAVVVAPLYEELMFRVVLQGWLGSLMKPVTAIPIVAAIFGAIHGLPDGIALLPLALVLGYVFDRRHSYLSVVVIHGLFNATMLTLALLGQG